MLGLPSRLGPNGMVLRWQWPCCTRRDLASSPTTGELVEKYNHLVTSGELREDPHQRRVVRSLQKLMISLGGYVPAKPSFFSQVCLVLLCECCVPLLNHMHTRIHAFMHTHMHTRIHAFMHTHMHTHAHAHTPT